MPDSPPSAGRAEARLLAATLSAMLLVIAITSWQFWRSPHLFEQGDLAANALQVERAREGSELLGPYSQHEFNHPGPASFYLQAWSEPLFAFLPSRLARHLAAQAVVNLLACGTILWLLSRAGARRGTVAAGPFLLCAPLLFLSGGNAIMLASVWGPTMAILPMALAVVAAARLAEGDLAALPAAAAAGVLAAHNHVLAMPSLALLAVATTVVRCTRPVPMAPPARSRPGRLLAAAAAAVAIAGTAPIVVQQATGKPGNLTLMVQYLRGQSPGSHAWREVLAQLGPAFTDPLVVLFPAGARVLAGPVVTALVVTAFAVASARIAWRRRRPWRLVLGFAWLVIGTTVLLARATPGKLETYLFYYLYGMVGLVYAAVADGALVRLSASRWRPGRPGPALGAAAGIAILAGWLAAHPLSAPPARDEVGDLIATLGVGDGAVVRLVLGSGPDDEALWPQVPTHALRLRRAGCRVIVPERFVVMCGREMAGTPGDSNAPSLEFTRETPPGPEAWPLPRDGWQVLRRGFRRAAGPDGTIGR